MSATAAGLTAGVLGCRGEETVEPDDSPATEERVDIPLRVTWVGEEAEFDVVRRAWGGVSPLPLEMTAIGLARDGAPELDGRIEESADRSDVVIYPLTAQAGLFAADRLTPWIADVDGDDRSLVDRISPALRNAAATYAGAVIAVPLGTRQAAWVSVDGDDPPQTWADYDAWVEGVDGGAVEPLAPGWAAAMFLLRAATSLDRGWLFERSGMEPTVATDPYVAVLEQMRQTASRYSIRRVSPAELWSRIGRGEIRGGIGFPAGEERSVGTVRFHDPPTELAVRRVWLDPFTTVGSVAANCRQTAAARRFLRWLAGGPGSESIRREIARLTMPPLEASGRRTRVGARDDQAAGRNDPIGPEGNAGGNASAPVSTDPYQRWLAAHLGEAVTAPTLRLLNGKRVLRGARRRGRQLSRRRSDPGSGLVAGRGSVAANHRDRRFGTPRSGVATSSGFARVAAASGSVGPRCLVRPRCFVRAPANGCLDRKRRIKTNVTHSIRRIDSQAEGAARDPCCREARVRFPSSHRQRLDTARNAGAFG